MSQTKKRLVSNLPPHTLSYGYVVPSISFGCLQRAPDYLVPEGTKKRMNHRLAKETTTEHAFYWPLLLHSKFLTASRDSRWIWRGTLRCVNATPVGLSNTQVREIPQIWRDTYEQNWFSVICSHERSPIHIPDRNVPNGRETARQPV